MNNSVRMLLENQKIKNVRVQLRSSGDVHYIWADKTRGLLARGKNAAYITVHVCECCRLRTVINPLRFDDFEWGEYRSKANSIKITYVRYSDTRRIISLSNILRPVEFPNFPLSE